LCVFGIPLPSNAQICETQVTLIVKDEVLGLHVSVQDALVVQVLEGLDDAGDEEL